jgi:hypothetical protein
MRQSEQNQRCIRLFFLYQTVNIRHYERFGVIESRKFLFNWHEVVLFLPTFGLPAVKINAELPLQRLLPHIALIIKDLVLAFQLPLQVLKNDVPNGKIIQTPFSTTLLKMVSRFPVPILGS